MSSTFICCLDTYACLSLTSRYSFRRQPQNADAHKDKVPSQLCGDSNSDMGNQLNPNIQDTTRQPVLRVHDLMMNRPIKRYPQSIAWNMVCRCITSETGICSALIHEIKLTVQRSTSCLPSTHTPVRMLPPEARIPSCHQHAMHA